MSGMVKRLITVFTIGFLAASVSITVRAQEDPKQDEEVVVVTATRTPEVLSKTPSSVTVITQKDIEKTPARTVADILSDVTGTYVKPQGSLGGLSMPSLRGTDSKQTLVLLDGIPLDDIRQGGTDVSQISVEEIERIEIYRGPGSSLYGANAMGGVINIITKSVKKEKTLSITGGAHDTSFFKFSGGETLPAGGFSFSGSKGYSGGIRPNSNYDSLDTVMKFDYNAAGWDKVNASLRYYSDNKGIPGPISSPTAVDRQWDDNMLLSLTGERWINSFTKMTTFIYGKKEKMQYQSTNWTTGGLTKDEYNTNQIGMQAQFAATVNSKLSATYGLDVRQDSLDTTTPIKKTTTISALFTEANYNLEKYGDLRFGLRLDDHSTYGSQIDPRAGWFYKYSNDTRFRVQVGRAYRAPTFNELYWPFTDYGGGFTYQGNPNLKPETAWSYEAGVDHTFTTGLYGKLTVFEIDTKDLIDPGVTIPLNVGNAVNKGIEGELNYKLTDGTNIFANLSLTSAKDGNGVKLLRRPETTFNMGISSSLPKGFIVSLVGEFVGHRQDIDFSTYPSKNVTLPTYTLVNLKISKEIYSGVKADLGITNLFDTDYEAIKGYPMPGREGFFGLDYAW